MNYQELLNYLLSKSDKKFADFSKTLSNSDYQVIGVNNPELREIIKSHKNDSELNPKDFELGKYLEVDFIYFGLSLSRLKSSEQQLDFLKKEIKKAKSWAITDCMMSFLKKVSFEQFSDFFHSIYLSKHTYDRRMAYVLALKQYKDKRIVDILPLIQPNEEYMVMMAEAWMLSTVAITFEDDVFNCLVKLDDMTLKRKTISKICDSFRFSEESKNKFRKLR